MTVLLVDDEEDIRFAFGQSLEIEGLTVKTYARANRIFDQIDAEFDGVVVSDIRMPQMDGIELAEAARAVDSDIPVILVTGNADVDLAVKAMKLGAYDFLQKPVSPALLVETVKRALERRRLVLENRALRDEIARISESDGQIIGASAEMVALREDARKIAKTDLPVIIEGVTGTGKNLFAKFIHDQSDYANGPFLVIPIAELSQQNLDDYLFGHVPNYEQALRTRIGRLEHGRGGTIVLDEIGALPFEMQAKLLHVIERGEMTPLGGGEPIALNARFIATSKEPIASRVEAGQFRDDFYYRLNGASLKLPSLSERSGDIPRLFEYFLNDFAEQIKTTPRDVTPEFLMVLAQQSWPGNVRQLKNAAKNYLHNIALYPQDEPGTLGDMMAAHEKKLIETALAAHQGKLKPVYESLGISRKNLYEKMQKYGLKRE